MLCRLMKGEIIFSKKQIFICLVHVVHFDKNKNGLLYLEIVFWCNQTSYPFKVRSEPFLGTVYVDLVVADKKVSFLYIR